MQYLNNHPAGSRRHTWHDDKAVMSCCVLPEVVIYIGMFTSMFGRRLTGAVTKRNTTGGARECIAAAGYWHSEQLWQWRRAQPTNKLAWSLYFLMNVNIQYTAMVSWLHLTKNLMLHAQSQAYLEIWKGEGGGTFQVYIFKGVQNLA